MSSTTFDQAAAQPPRIARLVLVTPDGAVVGALPEMPVALPWWQDAESVVRAARQHGVDVTILRLLETERDRPHGGAVTYLAEVQRPCAGRAVERPARPPRAAAALCRAGRAGRRPRLGGIRARRARHRAGRAPVQVRSWNLSSVWRIPVAGQTAWLKVVPPFFAHEGRVLAALAGGPVPRLLGHDGGRVLLAEIPGEDMYEAALPSCSTW